MVTVLDNNTPMLSEGPYFVEAKAERRAKLLSRQFTSPTVTVQLASFDVTDQLIRARTYRMGKLYRP